MKKIQITMISLALCCFAYLQTIVENPKVMVKMDNTTQSKLLTDRGYCEQVRGLMEI
jgi:hypothetical protein